MRAKDKLLEKLNFRSNLSSYVGPFNRPDLGLDKYAHFGFVNSTRLVFMNKDIVVFTGLKYGKHVFETYLNRGNIGTLYRFRDNLSLTVDSWRSTADPTMTREQAQANLNNLFSSSKDERVKLFLIRDPLEKMVSAIIQLAFHSSDLHVKETLFNTALKDFEKFSFKDHKIITNLVTRAEYNRKKFNKIWDSSNVETGTNSPAYIAMKEYFKFVMTNYSYILLTDPHVCSLVNTNTLHFFNTILKETKLQSKVILCNLDNNERNIKEFSFIDYIYMKYKLVEREDLKIDSEARHSTYRLKGLVKEALRELNINSYIPYFNIMSREYYALREIVREYNHLYYKQL